MKYRWAVSVLVLHAVHAAPVQKVLSLLEEMKVKGNEAIEAEKKQHQDFTAFCEETKLQKQKAIDDGQDRIEQLKVDIEKFGASITTLTSELETHETEIAEAQAESKKTTALREQQKIVYNTSLHEYQDSLSAIRQALDFLKAASQLTLSQLSSLRSVKLHQLEAFLADPKAYNFQSKAVVEMLKKLGAKFAAELEALQEAEVEAKAAHLKVMTGLANQEATASEAKDEKTQLKSKAKQSLASAEADLEEASSTLKQDIKYRKDLVIECTKKSEDFASNMKLRKEEMEAIEKASEIIAGKAVSGAEKHLSGLLQGTSLALLRAPKRDALNAALRALSSQSDTMALLIEQIEEPKNQTLQGVKTLLQQYLANLRSDRAAEIEHESFCTRELSGNNRTRKFKAAAVESLTAEIEQLKASLAKVSEDSADVSKQIAELSSALSEATQLRGKEKAKNGKTISESQAAQEAVTQAINILQDAFEKTAGLSLLQSSKTGVVSLLETLLGDFSRLEAEAQASEQAAEADFKAFREESNMDKAAKQSDAEHLTELKAEQSRALKQKEEDLAAAKTERASAEKYFEELSKQCLSSDADAAKAKAHREKEIENLKTALKELE